MFSLKRFIDSLELKVKDLIKKASTKFGNEIKKFNDFFKYKVFCRSTKNVLQTKIRST